MKKLLILILVLFSLSSIAQTDFGYTYIGQKYKWMGGLFNALGIPSGDNADFTGSWQHRRAGALYYDSTGIDSGLYVWSGLAWRMVEGGGGAGTAGEGLYVSGDSMHLGGLIGSPAVGFSQWREVNTNRKGIIFRNGDIPDLVDPGGVPWGFGQEVFSPFQILGRDTVNANDVDPPTAAVPWSTLHARRELYFPTGVFRTQKVFGHTLEMRWKFDDTLSLNTQGGDYNTGVAIDNYYEPYGTDRQGIRASHGTGQNLSIAYAAPALLVRNFLRNDGSNYIKVNGHLSGVNSFFIGSSNDSIGGIVFYTTGAFFSGYAGKVYDFAPGTRFPPPFADSSFLIFDTSVFKRNYMAGPTVLGPSKGTANTWSSSDVLKVLGNLNVLDSMHLGKAHNSGTLTGFRAMIRRTSDGAVFEAEPSMFGSTLDLQAVTDVGSITTNPITAAAFHAKPSYTSDWVSAVTFTGNGITANGNLVLRENSDGTGNMVTLSPLAMASDIELFLPETADGDTLATKAYARSVGGSGGANTALSNLASVAVNTSLISDADNTDDLGSSANAWKDVYVKRVLADGSTSGGVEFKSDALGNAPAITTLSGTGYGCSCFEVRETSDFTGQNINTVQPMFNTAIDVWPLQASTSYDFEGFLSLSHGATSHSLGLSFELSGGASVTSISYLTLQWVTAIGTQTASQTSNIIQVATNTSVNAAGANATEQVFFKGTINMNAAGNVTPSYTFSAAPGGTVLTKAGSYIKFCPKGTNTFTNIGPAN